MNSPSKNRTGSPSLASLPASMLASCALVLVGCTADKVGTDLGPDADIPVTDVALTVDRPDATTGWGSIPVTGVGPSNGTLVWTTPGGGQFFQDLGGTGVFCVDVLLQDSANNTIKFEAIDGSGEYSSPVLIDVRQTGEAPGNMIDPANKPGYTNILSGASVSAMSVAFEEGAPAALVDGDFSTPVSIRNDSTNEDWLVFNLNERLPIQQFRFQSSPDCILEEYRILLSDETSGPPVEETFFGASTVGEGWAVVAQVVNGQAKETVTPPINDPLARRFAIEFISGDCGTIVGLHKITEIEVWGRDDGNLDPPIGGGAPSCTGL